MNRIFRCMLLLFFCTCQVHSWAQVEEDIPVENAFEMKPDTNLYNSGISIRAGWMDSLRSEEKYAYFHYMDSLLKKQKNDFLKNTDSKPKRTSWFQRLFNAWEFKAIFWMLIIFLIGAIMYVFGKRSGVFKKNTSSSAVAIHGEEALLQARDHMQDYVSSKAIQDHRSAVKYLFLQTLKILCDKNHISFAPGKTNAQYLDEMPVALQREFASLSMAYEYIWYGNQQLAAMEFATKEKSFLHFIEHIQQS